MKTITPRISLAVAALLLVFQTPVAGADSKDTYWTNVDGVTIWARLTGIHGSEVLLVRSGREYRVPTRRLTPESLRKARRLLDLPETDASTAMATDDIPHPAPTPQPAAPLPEISGNADLASSRYAAVLPPRDLPDELQIVPPRDGSRIRLDGKHATPPSDAPPLVRIMVAAGNRLQDKTYKWGGGRARFEDSGYDCSGSVSYVLIKAGLLRSPITSGTFTRYGQAGPGRWITIHARHGHVFMTVCGLRLDTGYHGPGGERGPRWCRSSRPAAGFVMRHPPGL